ncbi:hypothetical protein [Paenibacillus xerothermodurans]|uniref:Serine/threonine protein kinase n=1 Tax=Paenibacillus xerothermodurans TaxID=1977292 RepID=A0A2W1P1X9_PAEXE|nr:hypothetical protein [Paenibacillus xerothermodurans]PZE21138.1 hypothetical protein CBW46_010705 [Paenibacillus xerothermodurans]
MAKFLSDTELQSINSWITKLERGGRRSYAETDVIEALRLRYKLMGTGKHRLVFDMGNGYVLKVARKKSGITCNRNEVVLYEQAPRSLQQYLCEIVDYGDGWLIMPNMQRTVHRRKHAKKLAKIWKRFLKFGVNIHDVLRKNNRMIRAGNVRLKNKKELVIIDYGNWHIERNSG